MPDVSGDLKEIVGSSMHGKDPEILFTLNAPNAYASGGSSGRILTTEPAVVKPASDGTFTCTLAMTTAMVDQAWYNVQVRWQGADANATLIDFPDWRIVVAGDGELAKMIQDPNGVPGGSNGRMVYVSLAEPPKGRPFSLWLHSDPNDPDNSNRQSSGRLYELRNV